MLELAYARRESNLVFLNVDPLIAPLRSEPRFITITGPDEHVFKFSKRKS